MIRILIGSVEAGLAGGIYVTESLFTEALKAKPGCEVRVFRYGGSASGASVFKKILDRGLDFLRYKRELFFFKPHLVHFNSSFDEKALLRDLFYLFFTRSRKRALFLKYHGSRQHLLESPKWAWCRHFLQRKIAGVGALSFEEKMNFVRAGFPESMVHVVPNAVDVSRFAKSAGVLSAKPKKEALFISRIIPAKGLRETIEALKLLKDEGVEQRVQCVGDGSDLAYCKELAERLGVSNQISFLGGVSEQSAFQYYLDSSFLIFPTYHSEGFSMVIFQSLAAGLPILTTQIRAAADFLKEPDNVLWVESKNPRQLANRIKEMAASEEQREKMSVSGKQLVLRFAPERVVEDYLKVYLKTLSR